MNGTIKFDAQLHIITIEIEYVWTYRALTPELDAKHPVSKILPQLNLSWCGITAKMSCLIITRYYCRFVFHETFIYINSLQLLYLTSAPPNYISIHLIISAPTNHISPHLASPVGEGQIVLIIDYQLLTCETE